MNRNLGAHFTVRGSITRQSTFDSKTARTGVLTYSSWKTALGIGAFLLASSIAQAQDSGVGWDADDSLPPPVSHQIVLRRPAKVQPFHLLVYESCSDDSTTTNTWGQMTRIDLFSAYGFAKFDSWSTDSSMQITVRLRTPVDTGLPVELLESRRGKRRTNFRIPGKDFALSVILGRDTARFRVRQTGPLEVEYVRKSSLLLLDTTCSTPDDIVSLQLMSKDPKEARRVLQMVAERFGSDAIPTTLSPGYYPCTAALWVNRIGIGRRRTVNETTLGYLLCFRLPGIDQRSELKEWWRDATTRRR